MTGKQPTAPSAFAIRMAGATDADGILECLRTAFEPYRESYTTDGYEDTVLSVATVARRLTQMRVFVATSAAGEIVGTVGYGMHGDAGHLRGMAVRPEWLGSGVAQRLLKRSSMKCAEWDARA